MVVDTSAVIAILLGEPEAEAFATAIARAPKRKMSAVCALEAGIVIEARKGEEGGRELDLLLQKVGVEVVPLDAKQVEVARAAWRRFGKGRHPASLNMGDCCSYALAWCTGDSLLFKGDDFSRTDIA